MKRKILPIVFIICLILVLLLETIYIGINSKNIKVVDSDSKNETKHSIVTYEVQTHEYFNNKKENSKYIIDTEDELNAFYKVYSDEVNINRNLLSNNIAFVEVREASSGSISMKLNSVSLDNNRVSFDVKVNVPEMGTADMACWYLVAIIPKKDIEDYKFDDWSRATKEVIKTEEPEFKLDSSNKYIVTTDMRFLTMQNDGGSNTSIYYEIDLDNNIVRKVEKNYKANLAGTSSTTYKMLFEVNIPSELNLEIKDTLDGLISLEDIVDDTYHYYSIETLNSSKNISNEDIIKSLKKILDKIDFLV